MKKQTITLTIVTDEAVSSIPQFWNWNALLDLGANESVEVVSFTQPEAFAEIIESPSGWVYRAEQENGDNVDCNSCGKTLDDDFPIYTNNEGFAHCSEACILATHDANETLHHFVESDNGCALCEDTAEGLMHKNTVRDIEPLLWTGE